MPKINWILLIILVMYYNSSFGQTTPDGFRWYTVKPGDTLEKISPREHWGIEKRVNRIDEFHLIIGRKILLVSDLNKATQFLPVPKLKDDLKDNKKTVEIFLTSQYFGAYENGNLVFWGPISSGKKDYLTLKGKFKVLWKSRKYYSKKYDSDMPFAVCFSNRGYFLHAQSLPGRPASHGCVRLLREDANKLYYWIKKGDVVIVD